MSTSRFFLIAIAFLVVLTVSLSVVASYNISQSNIANCKAAYANSNRTVNEINTICDD